MRIFPREDSYFGLFEAAAANIAAAAEALLEMVTDFVDPHVKAKRLRELEHEGDRITRTILSQLNATFITPFDREDIYTLASQLDDVIDAIEESGDLMVLHKVIEPIQPVCDQVRLLAQAANETATGLRHLRKLEHEHLRAYWMRVNDLENAGDRLYRQARADLYAFETEHPARYVLIWKDIIEQLEDALDGLQHVARTVESIALKYS